MTLRDLMRSIQSTQIADAEWTGEDVDSFNARIPIQAPVGTPGILLYTAQKQGLLSERSGHLYLTPRGMQF